jgi:lipoprotein-releasing system ATP-binding protein
LISQETGYCIEGWQFVYKNFLQLFKIQNYITYINVFLHTSIFLSILQSIFISIIGPSGSGKSTLLYILGLLDQPTDGKVFVENQETNFKDKKRISEIRNKKFGFVFQFHYLINELTALENVMVPMLKSGVEKSLAVDIAIKNLEKLGLEKSKTENLTSYQVENSREYLLQELYQTIYW